jgi:hypothetical protein
MLVFIFTRHVNSPDTNKYWIEAYRCIRAHYPENTIIIIDDNSNYNYITDQALKLTNVYIIQSEFPQRGELLAYYYFSKFPQFTKAVILHDSTFIQQKIETTVDDIKFLWHFKHDWDNKIQEQDLIKELTNSHALINTYENQDVWHGCFGVQSIISQSFLANLITKYNIFALLKVVTTREKRMAVERIFALLCCIEKPDLVDDPSLYGRIHDYCPWSYSFEKYKQQPLLLPIIKVWTGR